MAQALKKIIPAPTPNYRPLIWEKRRERRFPTNDPVDVQVLPASGPSLVATLVEISRFGLRLQLRAELPKHTPVQITLQPQGLLAYGDVRHCHRVAANFEAGVLLEGIVFPNTENSRHIHRDQLLLYVEGQGLSAGELFCIIDHLTACQECFTRFREVESRSNLTPR